MEKMYLAPLGPDTAFELLLELAVLLGIEAAPGTAGLVVPDPYEPPALGAQLAPVVAVLDIGPIEILHVGLAFWTGIRVGPRCRLEQDDFLTTLHTRSLAGWLF